MYIDGNCGIYMVYTQYTLSACLVHKVIRKAHMVVICTQSSTYIVHTNTQSTYIAHIVHTQYIRGMPLGYR